MKTSKETNSNLNKVTDSDTFVYKVTYQYKSDLIQTCIIESEKDKAIETFKKRYKHLKNILEVISADLVCSDSVKNNYKF